MNNMHWDEATQTYRGTAVPYEMPDQTDTANSNVHFGHNKPLLLSPEWLQDYYGSGPRGSDWYALPQPGATGPFSTRPLPWPVESHQGAQSLERSVQQLTQAMAGFAAPDAGLTEPATQSMFSPFLQMAVDGSRFA